MVQHQPWPNCCGTCRRHGICPTPEACQISELLPPGMRATLSQASAPPSTEPDPPRPPRRAGDLVRVIGMLLAAWAAVAATLVLLGVRL